MGSNRRIEAPTGTVEEFIARWQRRKGGQERANYSTFLTEVRTAAMTQKAGVDPLPTFPVSPVRPENIRNRAYALRARSQPAGVPKAECEHVRSALVAGPIQR